MKKLFNNTIMRVMLALGMFAMAGCTDYTIDSQPEAAANVQDDALETYIMAAESAAGVVFNISANTPWRIDRSEGAQWLTVSPSMSATSSLVSEISITAEDNTDFSPRSATLTITAQALPNYSKTITVYQASKGDFLLTDYSADIEAEGGEAIFYIYTNKAWEYRPISGLLVASGDTSGEDADEVKTYELHITVPANTGLERDLSFMIHTATEDYERTLHQIGIELRLADGQEENTKFTTYEPGEEITFEVKANIPWKAELDEACADWLEIVSADDNGKGGSVTLRSKGDVNPYLQKRKGLVRLTSSGVSPVEVEILQPVAYTINNIWTGAMDLNEDMSVTIHLDDNIETRIFNSDFTGTFGTWTVEFDPSNANLSEAHLYFILSNNGEESGDYYRSALTPHVVTNQGAGIYNNFVQKNGSFANGRWNFDGVAVNGTPTSTDPSEIMAFADMPKIEKVTYEFAKAGMTMTIYTNGKVYSRQLAVPAANEAAYTTLVNSIHLSFRTIKAAAGQHVAHTGFPGEYVTFKKVYFTPAN